MPSSPQTTTPIVMTIAGSDSSGGAGIQADLKTFTALGVYGATVITALTAQNTKGVTAVHTLPADFVAKQFDAVTNDLDVAVAKIGMLGTSAIAQAVADALSDARIPLTVIDPVMVATSGDTLADEDTVALMKTRLFPQATLVTPNRAEAAKLTGQTPFNTSAEAEEQGRMILEAGCGAVLMKGGHANEETATDILVTPTRTKLFERPRIETTNTHGTGCTLASAISAFLARGADLEEAVSNGKTFVWNALSAGASLKIGHGNGPIDHLFARRPKSE